MTYKNEFENTIGKKVESSLGTLFKNDLFLLKYCVNERSITHKLAEYLQRQFPDWNVDCEYNKKFLDEKTLKGIRECDKKRKSDRIYPDIIIHKRNTKYNLLVIEAKKDDEYPCDIKKLEKLTSFEGKFKYKLGLFIIFNSERKPLLRWFRLGTETPAAEIFTNWIQDSIYVK